MFNATKTSEGAASAIRDLALAEIDTVSGGNHVGFPVATLERLEAQRRLTEAYKAHHADALGDAIKDRFQAGFGQ